MPPSASDADHSSPVRGLTAARAPRRGPGATYPGGMQRWIDLDGVVNMRDVGGLPTRDGGLVRPGRLIRSDNLQDLSPGAVCHLVDDLGVTDIVDLRSHKELHATGDGPLRATTLRHHHHSFIREQAPGVDVPGFLAADPVGEPRPKDANFWSQHYRGYLTERPDSVSGALSVVATATGATVVHCAAGKDRTGTVVGLALAVAGVPDEEIIADYVLSGERIQRIIDRLIDRDPYRESLRDKPVAEQVPLASSMEGLLGMLAADYGGAAGWLLAHGWTADQVAALRAKLLA